MKYRFMFKDGGWWLKIDTAEQLLEYHNNVEVKRIAEGLNSYFHAKEFFSDSTEHASTIGFAIGINAINQQKSGTEIALDILTEKYNLQLACVNANEPVYVNCKGGWFTGEEHFTSWCDRNELVFPSFTKDQIRVKQFTGGEHFYAYIDDMQVRDGDTVKWNTYEEAYNQAVNLVNKA